MQILEWLSQTCKTQSDLAYIIKREEVVTDRDRVRAHRIYHGAMPNEEEMPKIWEATGGQVTANDFYGLPASDNKSNPKKLKIPRSE